MSDLEEPEVPIQEYLNLLVLLNARIYDTLIVMLSEQNPAAADALTNKHAEMKFTAPMPFMEE